MAEPRGNAVRPFLLPRGFRMGGLRGPPLMPALRPAFASLRPPLRELLYEEPPAKKARSDACSSLPGSSAAASASLSPAAAADRAVSIDSERVAAIEAWLPLLRRLGPSSGVLRKMMDAGEPVDASAPTLASVFAGKSNGTLRKRLFSLLLFERWCATAGFRAFPVEEATVFSYFTFLQSEKAPPTRAQATREALNFVGGVLAVPVADVAASRRVVGSALLSLERKKLLRQRAP